MAVLWRGEESNDRKLGREGGREEGEGKAVQTRTGLRGIYVEWGGGRSAVWW